MARGQYQQCAHRWKGGRTLVHLERAGEPVRSPKIISVPGNQQFIPSPPSMLSCDKRWPLDTWNLSGSQENVFVNPRSLFESSQTPYQGILHSATPSATGAVPVHVCTGTPIGSTIPMPTFGGRPSTIEFPFASGRSTEFYGCTAKTAGIGTAIRQVPHTFNVLMVEDKIQTLGNYLF